MVATLIGEIWEARDGILDIIGGTASAIRAFRVKTDDKNDGAFAAMLAPGIPMIGEQHPDGVQLWAGKGSARCRSEDWTDWEVTITYVQDEFYQNPVLEPAKITWDTEQYQMPFVYDVLQYIKKGKKKYKIPVTNSAGDLFNPPLTKDDSRRTIHVEKNVLTVPAWFLDTQDCVNSRPFLIDGFLVYKYKAKIQRVSVSPPQERQGYYYRKITMDIHLRWDGWTKHPLDAGFRELKEEAVLDADGKAVLDADGSVKTVTKAKNIEVEGEPIQSPALLDGKGHALKDIALDTANFRTYYAYRLFDFNNLPLQ